MAHLTRLLHVPACPLARVLWFGVDCTKAQLTCGKLRHAREVAGNSGKLLSTAVLHAGLYSQPPPCFLVALCLIAPLVCVCIYPWLVRNVSDYPGFLRSRTSHVDVEFALVVPACFSAVHDNSQLV